MWTSLVCLSVLGVVKASIPVNLGRKNLTNYKVGAKNSIGIEFLNHEIYGGGVWAQMVFGESFEEGGTTVPPAAKFFNFVDSSTNTAIRHCDYQAWATPFGFSPDQDYDWSVQAGISGTKNTMTLFSANYPSMVLAPINETVPGRLGLVTASSIGDPKTASFFIKNLGDNAVTLQQEADSGKFVMRASTAEGTCSKNFPSPPSVAVALGSVQESWTMSPATSSLPVAQRGFFGCGVRDRAAGWSQDVVSQVSEMWMPVADAPAVGEFGLQTAGTSAAPPNGVQYQSVSYSSSSQGGGRVGVANYGLNCQLGMVFVGGRDYNGFVFARANASSSSSPVMVTVTAEDASDASSPVPVGSTVIEVPRDGTWHRFNFSFVTTSGTTCGTMNATETGEEDLLECYGRMVLAVHNPGDAVDFDLVRLYPGSWGLVDAPWSGTMGLPASTGLPDMMRDEGIKVLRMGGSMDNRDTYRWKFFRGPRDERQPYQGLWYQQSGLTQSRGFGMFEMIDLCQYIGCEPLITLNNLELPSDLGDFVEYCWGDSSTTWGAQRIKDGHPEPYNVTHVEIGNEQGLDSTLLDTFINITAAMDARSKAIGAPLFSYYIGHNLNLGEIQTNRDMVVKFIQAGEPYGSRALWDFHLGAEPEDAINAEVFTGAFQNLVHDLNSNFGGWVCLEENGGDHGLLRGLGHAVFGNTYIRANGSMGSVHGFADAVEAWQGMDKEQAFPQGQLFYAPNMTFAQPPFYAIKLASLTNREYGVFIQGDGIQYRSSHSIDMAATATPDSCQVSLRIVSWNQTATTEILPLFLNDHTPPTQVDLYRMQGRTGDPNEENSPAEPNRISIIESQDLPFTPGNTTFPIPPMTFTVLTFSFC